MWRKEQLRGLGCAAIATATRAGYHAMYGMNQLILQQGVGLVKEHLHQRGGGLAMGDGTCEA